MTATSKQHEKRVYVVGEIVGGVEVVEVYSDSSTRSDRAVAACRCVTCDHVRPMRYPALRAQQAGRSKRCPRCRGFINVPIGKRLTRLGCRVCSDCPKLRPADGSPCKCGETKSITKRTYGSGHPYERDAIIQAEQTAAARAEKKALWDALPKAPRAKRQIQRIAKQQHEVRHVKAKAKIGYMEKLDAAIARAKAGTK